MGTTIAGILCFLLILLALVRFHFQVVAIQFKKIKDLEITYNSYKEIIKDLNKVKTDLEMANEKLEKDLEYCEDQRMRKGKKKK